MFVTLYHGLDKLRESKVSIRQIKNEIKGAWTWARRFDVRQHVSQLSSKIRPALQKSTIPYQPEDTTGSK